MVTDTAERVPVSARIGDMEVTWPAPADAEVDDFHVMLRLNDAAEYMAGGDGAVEWVVDVRDMLTALRRLGFAIPPTPSCAGK